MRCDRHMNERSKNFKLKRWRKMNRKEQSLTKNIYIYIYTHTYIYIYINMCVYVCMYVYMYV